MTKTTNKIISLIVLICFAGTQTVTANPGAGIEIATRYETPSFLQIDIPAELATLDGLYEAPPRPDPKLILHIQNAHANYGAQMKIKELLQYLHKTYAFKTIFVEGASEDLNPEYLKMFPDKERNTRLADFLAKQGELTGAELFVLSEDEDHRPETTDQRLKTNESLQSQVSSLKSGPVRAVGIENAALYRENYEALEKVFGSEKTVTRYLGGYETRLDGLASKVFTPELRKLLGDWKKFEKGHREFMPYVHTMVTEARKILAIDLESLLAQVEWPQITRLLQLQVMEKDLKMEKALAEKDQLIAFLTAKQVSAGLLTAIKGFQGQRVSVLRGRSDTTPAGLEPRSLMEKLVTEAGPKGFRFQDFPAFSTYAGYLILKNELDPKGLFQEIQEVFTRMLDTLAKTPRQKELLAIYRDEELVRKLLNLELPRKEWQEAVAKKTELGMDSMVERLKAVGVSVSKEANLPLSSFETKKISEKFRGEVQGIQTAAFAFYDAAHKREDVFYRKIEDVMTRDAVSKAVLVTGGFHTDGITDLLREHQVSYGILTPRLLEKSNEKQYREVMLQNKQSTFELSYLESVSRLIKFADQEEQLGKKQVIQYLKPVLRAIGYAGKFGSLADAIKAFNDSSYAKDGNIQIIADPIKKDAAGRPVYRVVSRTAPKTDARVQPAGEGIARSDMRSEKRMQLLKAFVAVVAEFTVWGVTGLTMGPGGVVASLAIVGTIGLAELISKQPLISRGVDGDKQGTFWLKVRYAAAAVLFAGAGIATGGGFVGAIVGLASGPALYLLVDLLYYLRDFDPLGDLRDGVIEAMTGRQDFVQSSSLPTVGGESLRAALNRQINRSDARVEPAQTKASATLTMTAREAEILGQMKRAQAPGIASAVRQQMFESSAMPNRWNQMMSPVITVALSLLAIGSELFWVSSFSFFDKASFLGQAALVASLASLTIIAYTLLMNMILGALYQTGKHTLYRGLYGTSDTIIRKLTVGDRASGLTDEEIEKATGAVASWLHLFGIRNRAIRSATLLKNWAEHYTIFSGYAEEVSSGGFLSRIFREITSRRSMARKAEGQRYRIAGSPQDVRKTLEELQAAGKIEGNVGLLEYIKPAGRGTKAGNVRLLSWNPWHYEVAIQGVVPVEQMPFVEVYIGKAKNAHLGLRTESLLVEGENYEAVLDNKDQILSITRTQPSWRAGALRPDQGDYKVISVLMAEKLAKVVARSDMRAIQTPAEVETISAASADRGLANKIMVRGTLEVRAEDLTNAEKLLEGHQVTADEEAWAREATESHRILSPEHPLSRELQGYLNVMASLGYPAGKIMIAVDGEKPVAGALGHHWIIVNMALLRSLRSVDELVAILAHEQNHIEDDFRDRQKKLPTTDDLITRLFNPRKGEIKSDLRTPSRLQKLGFKTGALGDALRSIAGAKSFSDYVHPDVSDRIIMVAGEHKVFDFEVAVKQPHALSGNPIPVEWVTVRDRRSLEEKFFAKSAGAEFREAVDGLSPHMLKLWIARLLDMDSYVTEEIRNNIMKDWIMKRKINQIVKRLPFIMGYSGEQAGVRALRTLLFFGLGEDLVRGQPSLPMLLRISSVLRHELIVFLRQKNIPALIEQDAVLSKSSDRGYKVARDVVWLIRNIPLVALPVLGLIANISENRVERSLRHLIESSFGKWGQGDAIQWERRGYERYVSRLILKSIFSSLRIFPPVWKLIQFVRVVRSRDREGLIERGIPSGAYKSGNSFHPLYKLFLPKGWKEWAIPIVKERSFQKNIASDSEVKVDEKTGLDLRVQKFAVHYLDFLSDFVASESRETRERFLLEFFQDPQIQPFLDAAGMAGRLWLIGKVSVLRFGAKTDVFEAFLALPWMQELQRQVVQTMRQSDRGTWGETYGQVVKGVFYYSWKPEALGKQLYSGRSEAEAAWMAPINQAYWELFTEVLGRLESESSNGEVIDDFIWLSQAMPDDPRSRELLRSWATVLVERLSKPDLKRFLSVLLDEKLLTPEMLDHISDKRIKTWQDYLFFENTPVEIFETLGERSRSGAVGVFFLDHVSSMTSAKRYGALFQSGFSSGTDDRALRLLMVPYWIRFLYTKVRDGLVIENRGGVLYASGPGIGAFSTFDEFMEDVYAFSPALKLLILKKLLVSPNGLLHNAKQRRLFAETIKAQLPQGEGLDSLIRDILDASVTEAEPEELFLMLARSILPMFLNRPKTPADVSVESLNRAHNKDLRVRAIPSEDIRQLLRLPKQAMAEGSAARMKAQINMMVGAAAEKLGFPLTSDDSKGSEEPKIKMDAVEIILNAARSLGATGIRFLQVLGQYMKLSVDQADRFRTVYDENPGQNSFVAWRTLSIAAKINPNVDAFLREHDISLDTVLGRGSLFTTFLVHYLKKDGTLRRMVLKVRNPNVKGELIRVTALLQKIVDRLEANAWGWRVFLSRLIRWSVERAVRITRSAGPGANVLAGFARGVIDRLRKIESRVNSNYQIARMMLKNILAWNRGDLEDRQFPLIDPVYHLGHNNYTASNGVVVKIPSSEDFPNGEDVRAEELVEGETLKHRFEGKYVTAVTEHFCRSLLRPLARLSGGDLVYVVHSDLHVGNVMVSPDGAVHIIDRNFYLKFSEKEMTLLRRMLGGERNAKLLEDMIDVMLETKENVKRLEGVSVAKLKGRLFDSIAAGLELAAGDPLSYFNVISQAMAAEALSVPLSNEIFLKELISIEGMLRRAKLEPLEVQLKNAEKLMAAEIGVPLTDKVLPVLPESADLEDEALEVSAKSLASRDGVRARAEMRTIEQPKLSLDGGIRGDPVTRKAGTRRATLSNDPEFQKAVKKFLGAASKTLKYGGGERIWYSTPVYSLLQYGKTVLGNWSQVPADPGKLTRLKEALVKLERVSPDRSKRKQNLQSLINSLDVIIKKINAFNQENLVPAVSSPVRTMPVVEQPGLPGFEGFVDGTVARSDMRILHTLKEKLLPSKPAAKPQVAVGPQVSGPMKAMADLYRNLKLWSDEEPNLVEAGPDADKDSKYILKNEKTGHKIGEPEYADSQFVFRRMGPTGEREASIIKIKLIGGDQKAFAEEAEFLAWIKNDLEGFSKILRVGALKNGQGYWYEMEAALDAMDYVDWVASGAAPADVYAGASRQAGHLDQFHKFRTKEGFLLAHGDMKSNNLAHSASQGETIIDPGAFSTRRKDGSLVRKVLAATFGFIPMVGKDKVSEYWVFTQAADVFGFVMAMVDLNHMMITLVPASNATLRDKLIENEKKYLNKIFYKFPLGVIEGLSVAQAYAASFENGTSHLWKARTLEEMPDLSALAEELRLDGLELAAMSRTPSETQTFTGEKVSSEGLPKLLAEVLEDRVGQDVTYLSTEYEIRFLAAENQAQQLDFLDNALAVMKELQDYVQAGEEGYAVTERPGYGKTILVSSRTRTPDDAQVYLRIKAEDPSRWLSRDTMNQLFPAAAVYEQRLMKALADVETALETLRTHVARGRILGKEERPIVGKIISDLHATINEQIAALNAEGDAEGTVASEREMILMHDYRTAMVLPGSAPAAPVVRGVAPRAEVKADVVLQRSDMRVQEDAAKSAMDETAAMAESIASELAKQKEREQAAEIERPLKIAEKPGVAEPSEGTKEMTVEALLALVPEKDHASLMAKVSEVRKFVGSGVSDAVIIVALLVGGILDLNKSKTTMVEAARQMTLLADAIGGNAMVALKTAFAKTFPNSSLPASENAGLVIDILKKGIPLVAKIQAIKAMLALNSKQYFAWIIRDGIDVSAEVAELVAWGQRNNVDVANRLIVKAANETPISLRAAVAGVNRGIKQDKIRSFVVTGVAEDLSQLNADVMLANLIDWHDVPEDLVGTGMAVLTAGAQEMVRDGKFSEKTNKIITQKGKLFEFDITELRAASASLGAEMQGLMSLAQAA